MPVRSPDSRLLSRAADGNLPKLMAALADGANVNTQHLRHGTPLMRAVCAGHEPVIHALLAAGADPNVELFNVGTPLHALIGNSTSSSLLREAASLRIVTLLVMRGADLNRHGPNGYTPLLSAQASGNLKLVQHLLNLGADPNVCARNVRRTQPGQPRPPILGVSPLVHAAMSPTGGEIVRALLEAGAQVNAVDGNGSLPLHTAVSAQVPAPVVQRLLDAGADPACPGLGERDSLEEILQRRGLPAVRALFERRTLLDAMDEAVPTPIVPARVRPRM